MRLKTIVQKIRTILPFRDYFILLNLRFFKQLQFEQRVHEGKELIVIEKLCLLYTSDAADDTILRV